LNKSAAVALAFVLLAGCGGGGGGSSSVPAGSHTSTQSKAATGSVVISIPVASTTTQSLSRTVRYPQFVSPGASSVELSINGGPDTNFDVSATSSLCTTVSGLRNCTLSFAAPSGNDTFAFLIFSGPNGTGNQLASATSSQTIAAGAAFNFTVALNAAIGTLLISITASHGASNCAAEPTYETQNIINEGCAGSGVVTVAVEDPSGAPITGSAPYAVPINFTTNDPTITASPAQITAPGQTETVTYNGAAFAAGITNQAVITATAGGQTSQTTFPIRRSYLYVASANALPGAAALPGGGNVAVYQYGASGGTAPVRVISTGLNTPVAVQVDAAGNIYVLDNGTAISAIFNPSILVYPPGAGAGTPPTYTISNMGNIAVTGNQACSSMVFDPNAAHLFVACGSITIVFPVPFSASGLAANDFSTEWQDDGAGFANGFAFDPSGDLYLADSSSGVIDILAAPVKSTGAYGVDNGSNTLNSTPGTGWPASELPLSLFVDNSGALYAALPGSPGELAIWNNVPCGNCAPTTTFTGAPFNSGEEGGLTLDPAGNTYLANPSTNVVTEFSRATMTGGSAVAPPVLRTLTVSAGATGAFGMTVGP
jgi:hypothetical protein